MNYCRLPWTLSGKQDGVTSKTSNATQSYIKDATPNFIKKEWPPLSPGCNSLLCVVLSLAKKVYSGRAVIFTENELKKQIREMVRNHFGSKQECNLFLEDSFRSRGRWPQGIMATLTNFPSNAWYSSVWQCTFKACTFKFVALLILFHQWCWYFHESYLIFF